MQSIKVVLLLTICVSVNAQDNQQAREFFEGKRLTYIVPSKPGGGYDTYARLITRHLEKYLPVKSIRVENHPGAGGIVGANRLFHARPDGLTIGAIHTGMIYTQLMEKQGVRFDLNKFVWIGKASADPRVLIVGAQSGYSSINDLIQSRETVLFGSSGVGSASHNDSLIINRLLGIKFRTVPFLGGNDGVISIMRNEVVALYASYASVRPFVENGNGRILLHVGGADFLGDEIPAAESLISSAEGKLMIDFIASMSTLGRLSAAPPGTPTDRLALLRSAYDSTLADRELIAEAERLQLPIKPASGKEVATIINDVLNQSRELQGLIRSFSR